MLFYWVDRIVSLTEHDIEGEFFVAKHNPFIHKNGVLEAAMVGEALGQLCSWYVKSKTQFQQAVLAGSVKQIFYYQNVSTEAIIKLSVRVHRLHSDSIQYEGVAWSNGQKLCELIKVVSPLISLDLLNAVEAEKQQFHMLCQGTSPAQVAEAPFMFEFNSVQLHDNTAQATLILNPAFSYLHTHFPQKPVMPLSILLAYHFQLSHIFLRKQEVRVDLLPKIQHVRINQFIMPGDTIQFQIEYMMLAEQIILKHETFLNGGSSPICTFTTYYQKLDKA